MTTMQKGTVVYRIVTFILALAALIVGLVAMAMMSDSRIASIADIRAGKAVKAAIDDCVDPTIDEVAFAVKNKLQEIAPGDYIIEVTPATISHSKDFPNSLYFVVMATDGQEHFHLFFARYNEIFGVTLCEAIF